MTARFARLSPARAFLLALLAGAGAVAALPPLAWIVVFWPAFSLLFLLLESADERPHPARFRLLVGWGFGLGYFSAGLYWVAEAFLVDAATFGWMIPFVQTALGAGFGLFPAVAAWGAGFFPRRPIARWLALAGTWTVLEWVRGWFLTGFPWNAAGSVWAAAPAFAQAAAWIGMFGLSWLTVLAATAPAAGFLGAFGGRRGAVRGLAAALAIPALMGALGRARIPAAPVAEVPGIRLRLVQAAIPQREKWDPALRELNLMRQVVMSRDPGWENLTHVIWPETASTFDLTHDPRHRALAADAAPAKGFLLTGMLRTTPRGEPLKLWNSVVALSHDGRIAALYDKTHLVPFGEYVPLPGWIPVAKLTHGRVDFTPGPGLVTLRLPGTPPLSPLVCYEIIFPARVADPADRPLWLLNLTNDAWFGTSAGPHQHLASAVLRAIEEGLPVVRAAGTGISAVVDPYGRITKSLPLGRVGIIDSGLPRALAPTRFSAWGNLAALGLSLLGMGLAIWLGQDGLKISRRTPYLS